MHNIKIASDDDGEKIRHFIQNHWKNNHIFCVDKKLFDWQHYDAIRKRYNFVIGVDVNSNEIHGVLGFIPLSQFDSTISQDSMCWMAIWKTIESARGQKLGRRLLAYLEEAIRPQILSTVAASAMTLPMYQEKGFQVGFLSQYYILNKNKSSFVLVQLGDRGLSLRPDDMMDSDVHKKLELCSEADLINSNMDCFSLQRDLPRKTPSYIINRYLRHPRYSYNVYKILKAGEILGLVVTRVCYIEKHSAKAIRIIDFVGPVTALIGLQCEWQLLMSYNDAEYLDFYCAGIDENSLFASGFQRCVKDDGVIIPNYFEPFVKDRVEISYMVSVPKKIPFRIVKGDSDQDRPNLVKELKI